MEGPLLDSHSGAIRVGTQTGELVVGYTKELEVYETSRLSARYATRGLDRGLQCERGDG